MANWGSNVDDSLEEVNPFFRQNSVITVMVSFSIDYCVKLCMTTSIGAKLHFLPYFHSTFSPTTLAITFIRFIKIWVDQGLLFEGWDNLHQPLIKYFDHGIKENVSAHAQIRDLAKYSRFVKVGQNITNSLITYSFFDIDCSLNFSSRMFALFFSSFRQRSEQSFCLNLRNTNTFFLE